MPPKKQPGKKKLGAKEKKKLEEQLKITRLLKEVRRNYERNCFLEQSYCHVELRNHIKNCAEEGKILAKWILTESPPDAELKVKLLPLIAALRSVRYLFIKELYVWDILVRYQDLLALSQLLQQPSYSLSYLELVECKIDKYSLERFSECLSTSTLSALVLDYNEFGDEGCFNLCTGLRGNKTLIRLSLAFCDLTSISGTLLGKTVCHTAISELYLDGNSIECEGLIELIKMVVDKSEQEAIERRAEKEAKQLLDESAVKGGGLLGVRTGMSTMRPGSALSSAGRSPLSAKSVASTTSVKKKKKKKKSAKKKAPPEPPKVGPWLTKLHVNDNGIDSHGLATTYAPVLCMRLLKKWISTAADLKELDIDDNLIGDLGGREISDGLQLRKDAGLSNVTVWITHRMDSDTFNKILALGSGGGNKKKKKKGKAGKKRI